MTFFIVFTKHGRFIYSRGKTPTYLSSLIRSLPNLRSYSRSIQSEYCFVQSSFERVFLGIYHQNDPELLQKDIDAYNDKKDTTSTSSLEKNFEDSKNTDSVSGIDPSNPKPNPNSTKKSSKRNIENYKNMNLDKTTDPSNPNSSVEDTKSNDEALNDNSIAEKADRMSSTDFDTSLQSDILINPNEIDRSKSLKRLINSKSKAKKESFRTQSLLEKTSITSSFLSKISGLKNIFSKAQPKEILKEHLATQLHSQNVAPCVTDRLLTETLKDSPPLLTVDECRSLLKKSIKSIIGCIDHASLLSNKLKPFAMAFIGPNGVGKSTSIAKVACWFMSHNKKVLLVACDTFRAGAVEQLRAHAENLQCEIFDRGYAKSEVGVLKHALIYAKKNMFDIVLIDTAGRTALNKQLMDNLSSFLTTKDINHVCYVAEALTGNDSIEISQAFSEAARKGTSRSLDSIFVTKIDCAKIVGQVLNLCHYANAPVLFLGNGQAHTSIEKVDPELIAKSLLQPISQK